MLKELLETGYGVKEDLNCAEKILYGANRAYQLGFDRDDLKVAAGFGGGMALRVSAALDGFYHGLKQAVCPRSGP